MENASLCQTLWRRGKQLEYWVLAYEKSLLKIEDLWKSWLQNPEDTFHQLQTTITNCWIPIFSFTHLALSVGGEEPQKVSGWSRLHAFLWGGESYWESFHRELRSWDHLSSSQHQVYLWEDTKRQEDTRENLMPGVQSVGVAGKAKTSQTLHWYILAEVTNQSIWCHEHISLSRTSLIWMLQDVKMTNGEIHALIKEIIWRFFLVPRKFWADLVDHIPK